MNNVIEKKTGLIRLSNGRAIPCDATINTEETFNAKLVATVGEIMYYLEPNWTWDRNDWNKPVPLEVDENSIKKVTICKVGHATGCALCLNGITEDGREVKGIQELFFTTYEDALQAVDSINQFYSTNSPDVDWVKDYAKCVHFKYRYMLTFPLKPQDILLEDNKHYVANRVIAYIYPEYAEVTYQGHDDETYESGREVHSEHEYAGVKNQYSIVKLIEEKEQIIDI